MEGIQRVKLMAALRKVTATCRILAASIKWSGRVSRSDVNDAIAHINDSGEVAEIIEVRFRCIKTVHPETLVSTHEECPAHSGANHKPFGWMKSMPQSEWPDAFWDEYGREIDDTLRASSQGVYPPIVIDGLLGDGFARTQLAFSLGETLPVAFYRSSSNRVVASTKTYRVIIEDVQESNFDAMYAAIKKEVSALRGGFSDGRTLLFVDGQGDEAKMQILIEKIVAPYFEPRVKLEQNVRIEELSALAHKDWKRERPSKILDNVMLKTSELIKIKGINAEETKMDSAYSVNLIKKLADSILEHGYKADREIVIVIAPHGEARIAEGNHRIRAARQAGLAAIPANVHFLRGAEYEDYFKALKYLGTRCHSLCRY